MMGKIREEQLVKFGWTKDDFGHTGKKVWECIIDGKKPVAELTDKFELISKINGAISSMLCYDSIMMIIMVQGICEEEIPVGIKRICKTDDVMKDGEFVIWNDSKPQKEEK